MLPDDPTVPLGNNQSSQRRRMRNGFSLMEVIAAAALVGLMAMAAARPMRLAALGSLEAKTTARRLSLDLLRARRLAIITGTPHRLEFRREAGVIVGYELRRATNEIQWNVSLPQHLLVTASSDVDFQPTGEALQAAEIQLQGTHANGLRWKVEVARATGAVFVNSY